MKKHYNYNNISKNENQIIGSIQTKINKLTPSQMLKIKQNRLNNLTQNEIDLINKYKKVS
jgi:hypothetical protein